MSILEELTKDLPQNDPGAALAKFAERIEKRIIQKLFSPGSEADYAEITAFIEVFCSKFSIALGLEDLAKTHAASHYYLMKAYVNTINSNRRFLLKNYVLAQIEELGENFNLASGETFGLARLNSDEKKKIHKHIERIRSIIEESDISDRKKNALFDKLSKLASEVDAHGTKTDRFFAFAGDVAFVVGDMTNKSKPLLDEVKEMLRIISRSRARQEGISLPAGDEVLRLPSIDESAI
jgi:hypothetical protein